MGWFVRDSVPPVSGRNRSGAIGVAVVLWVFYAGSLATSSAARTLQQPAPSSTAGTVWTGVFNAAQVKRGEALSLQKCVICHGDELLGGEAPTLVGPDFIVHWNSHTAGELFDRIKTTMPATTPGTLSAQESADILAYMFSVNGFPAGEKELPSVMDALNQIRITERQAPR